MKTLSEKINGAKKVYDKNRKDVGKLLKDLDAGMKKHTQAFQKDSVNWGYVGDITAVKEDLQKIVDFLADQ